MRILCFGDSLTAGMVGGASPGYFPYSAALSKALPKHQVLNEGLGGDYAVIMAARLDRYLQDKAAKHRQGIDAVVLWGGTNDLSGGAGPDVIAAGLCACLEACARSGAEALLLTVPELAFERAGGGGIGAAREELNGRIRGGRLWEGGGEGGEGGAVEYAVADVAGALPSIFGEDGEVDETVRGAWYSDGVHMNKKGYARVAEIVKEELKGLLKKKSNRKGAGSG